MEIHAQSAQPTKFPSVFGTFEACQDSMFNRIAKSEKRLSVEEKVVDIQISTIVQKARKSRIS